MCLLRKRLCTLYSVSVVFVFGCPLFFLFLHFLCRLPETLNWCCCCCDGAEWMTGGTPCRAFRVLCGVTDAVQIHVYWIGSDNSRYKLFLLPEQRRSLSFKFVHRSKISRLRLSRNLGNLGFLYGWNSSSTWEEQFRKSNQPMDLVVSGWNSQFSGLFCDYHLNYGVNCVTQFYVDERTNGDQSMVVSSRVGEWVREEAQKDHVHIEKWANI